MLGATPVKRFFLQVPLGLPVLVLLDDNAPHDEDEIAHQRLEDEVKGSLENFGHENPFVVVSLYEV